MEERATFARDIQVHRETLQGLRARHLSFLKETPNLSLWKTNVIQSFLGLLIPCFGEIALFIYLFADWLGLDPLKISQEFLEYPVSALSIVSLSITVFIGLIMLARKALNSTKKWVWLVILFGIAVLVGSMRALQLSASQENEIEVMPGAAQECHLNHILTAGPFLLLSRVYLSDPTDLGHLLSQGL